MNLVCTQPISVKPDYKSIGNVLAVTDHFTWDSKVQNLSKICLQRHSLCVHETDAQLASQQSET